MTHNPTDTRSEFLEYWSELGKTREYIDLGMGMPPAGYSPESDWIREELLQGLRYVSAYQPQAGQLEVRKALANYEVLRTGLSIDAENVMLVGGALRGFSLILDTICNKRTKLVEIEPVYPSLAGYARTLVDKYRCSIHTIRNVNDKTFHLPAEDILPFLSTNTVLFITNPNNPTGQYLSSDVLGQFAERAADAGAWIVIDEACDTPYRPAPKRHAGTQQAVIRIRSFSKDLLIGGIRLGYVVAPKEVVSSLANRYTFSDGNAPIIANPLIIKHLGSDLWIRNLAAKFASSTQFVVDNLVEAGDFDTVIRPEASFYVFAKTKLQISSWELFRRFLNGGVNIVPGSLFGGSSNVGWIRICCGRDESTLEKGLKRIHLVIDGYA